MAPGYLKLTWLKVSKPLCSLSNLGFLQSLIDDLVLITSSIRSAATIALGSIIDIIVSIRNDITICMAYVINAVIEPTCITPLSILCAATHTIPTERQFIISIITGIINVMTLFVKSIVLVSSLFALSNLSSSFFSLPNALITDKPVSISLDTKLTLSTSFCICLNLGMAIDIRRSTKPTITSTASAITHPMPAPVDITFNTPPTPSIGAYSTILNVSTHTICICCTSFVVRVISEAVENLSSSALEKPITFLYTCPLKSRPTPAPTRDAKNATKTVHIAIINAIPIIFMPESSR